MYPYSTVKNTATHAVDLHDGRVLAPGEVAEDVDLNDPHNRALYANGDIMTVKESEPTAPAAEPKVGHDRDRSAVTGKFVTDEEADARPKTTVSEPVKARPRKQRSS